MDSRVIQPTMYLLFSMILIALDWQGPKVMQQIEPIWFRLMVEQLLPLATLITFIGHL